MFNYKFDVEYIKNRISQMDKSVESDQLIKFYNMRKKMRKTESSIKKYKYEV